jgi:glycosyltransferase involved in cell wall biosynthesis
MSPVAGRVIFISNLGSHTWGGSEELWSRTALNLASEGFLVVAGVLGSSPLHPKIEQLKAGGINLSPRPEKLSYWQRARWKIDPRHRHPALASLEKLITGTRAGLVVHSSCLLFPAVEQLELCISQEIPFVTIGHAANDDWWMDDAEAKRMRAALPKALRCYFVSEATRRFAEKQLGRNLANAEVVRNPFNVSYHAAPPWPRLDREEELRFACVGRLHPPSKGLDILFEALALPSWRERRWRLTLYGEGPMREMLEHLAQLLGIAERIEFAGLVADIEQVWAANHVLVMPSRYEGLPLAIVEAMLCARPVVATDVAGHAEVIEDGVTGFLADAPTVRSVASALERFWARRHEAEQIGEAAAGRIRELVPPDPAKVFAEKLKMLVNPRDIASSQLPVQHPAMRTHTGVGL